MNILHNATKIMYLIFTYYQFRLQISQLILGLITGWCKISVVVICCENVKWNRKELTGKMKDYKVFKEDMALAGDCI
jgi:hypothetical protein